MRVRAVPRERLAAVTHLLARQGESHAAASQPLRKERGGRCAAQGSAVGRLTFVAERAQAEGDQAPGREKRHLEAN